jgi:TPR repeat protein
MKRLTRFVLAIITASFTLGAIAQQRWQDPNDTRHLGPPKQIEALQHKVKSGDPYAMYELGLIYLEHSRGERDDYQALQLFSGAAMLDLPAAQTKLGSMLFIGRGAPRNVEVAASWIKRAAENGHVRAQALLGVSYLSGQGVPVDYEKHLQLLRQAATKNDSFAFEMLGLTFEHGLAGLESSYPTAYLLFELGGHNQHLSRVEANLSERRIAAIKRLASLWTPGTTLPIEITQRMPVD